MSRPLVPVRQRIFDWARAQGIALWRPLPRDIYRVELSDRSRPFHLTLYFRDFPTAETLMAALCLSGEADHSAALHYFPLYWEALRGAALRAGANALHPCGLRVSITSQTVR